MRRAQISLAILGVVILAGFTYLIKHSGATTEKLENKTIKLQSTETKLKDVNIQVEQLKTQSSTDKAKQEELQKQLEQKEQEKKDLEAKLQAKLEQKAKLELAAAEAERKLTATKQASASVKTYSGSHQDWMNAAGIPAKDHVYVDYIVSKESSWNPNAMNKSSGACGLVQALPCSKIPGAWNDPVNALRWQHGYVKARYGGYEGAYNFWVANKWY